jgi:hypothetical protein
VVGPEDSSAADAILDESDRIVREPAFSGQSCSSIGPQVRFAERRYQPRREAPSTGCRSYAAPTSTNSPSELGIGTGNPSRFRPSM